MKHIRLRMAVVALFAMTATGFLNGCAWSIGGPKEGETYTRPSQGQELIDLKRARDSGALSEQEYQDQRLKILTR